mgnify:CR=1 FL=1
MKRLNYVNKQSNRLYILHFPGHGLGDFLNIIDDNMDRHITISSDISIISTMNRHCWDNSPIRDQCARNNIPICNTALEEKDWSNPLKIKHSLICLEQATTEYALLVDGRDVVIVQDLDDEFIEKFKKFNKPILYNGTPAAYPKVPIEPLEELFQIRGKQKFLNAGVCFGEVEALKTFYTRCAEISATLPDNKSEQLIVRMARQEMKDLVAIDHNNELFRICHPYDTVIKEEADKIILI